MNNLLQQFLAFLGIESGSTLADLKKRRTLHLSIFTDLMENLEQDNQKIEEEKVRQLEKAAELKAQIREIESINKELGLLQNENLATVKKIASIL